MIADRSDILFRSWGNETVIKGQGKNPEVIAINQHIQGIGGVLATAVRNQNIIRRGLPFLAKEVEKFLLIFLFQRCRGLISSVIASVVA